MSTQAIPDSELAELTPEEAAELTPLNAAAFDLLRVEYAKQNLTPPTWLCLSVARKAEYRQKVIVLLRNRLYGGRQVDASVIDADVERVAGHKVELWRRAERRYKQLRNAGHMQAFYAR